MWKRFFVCVFLGLAGPAAGSELSEIGPEELYGALYYRQALEHPEIQRLGSERKKLAAVARDLRWAPKKLSAALAKIDQLGGDPIALGRVRLREKLGADPRLAGRVLEVLLSAEEPRHIVAYVRWRGQSAKGAVREASAIAALVRETAPFVATLSLAAIHPKAAADSKVLVWSGKIGREAMARINPKRIDDYAERLYKSSFEDVRQSAY